MNIIDPIMMEFGQEAANTRRMLERVPEEHLDWTPHEKSMSLGRLATHIAENPEWGIAILEQDELAFNMGDYVPRTASTRAELLDTFDANVARMTEAMQGTSDDKLMQPWRLRVDGEVKVELPRIAVLRGMVLNHMIHHRGQLSVYLRLKDVPLPTTYGPSADEAA